MGADLRRDRLSFCVLCLYGVGFVVSEVALPEAVHECFDVKTCEWPASSGGDAVALEDESRPAVPAPA